MRAKLHQARLADVSYNTNGSADALLSRHLKLWTFLDNRSARRLLHHLHSTCGFAAHHFGSGYCSPSFMRGAELVTPDAALRTSILRGCCKTRRPVTPVIMPNPNATTILILIPNTIFQLDSDA